MLAHIQSLKKCVIQAKVAGYGFVQELDVLFNRVKISTLKLAKSSYSRTWSYTKVNCLKYNTFQTSC